MRRYYHIDSNGEDTNLQLYSLKQAKRYWEELERDLASPHEPEDLHERCVFVVATMGLSVSQLLGQNNPHPEGKVPSPARIVESIAATANWPADVVIRFGDFISAYDHCRHFGATITNDRYAQIDSISVDRARQLYSIGLEVWERVIEYYREDPKNDLDELDLDHMW